MSYCRSTDSSDWVRMNGVAKKDKMLQIREENRVEGGGLAVLVSVYVDSVREVRVILCTNGELTLRISWMHPKFLQCNIVSSALKHQMQTVETFVLSYIQIVLLSIITTLESFLCVVIRTIRCERF